MNETSDPAAEATLSRRGFMTASAAGLLGAGAWPSGAGAEPRQLSDRPIASNVYPWLTFYERAGRSWTADLDGSLAAFAASGIGSYEPLMGTSPEQVELLVPLLRKHGLVMESLYMATTLHEITAAERSIEQVLRVAEAARGAGTRIIVTNPATLPDHPDKTDAQLETQARQLDRLGAALRGVGMTLAYHNHDPEMRNAAREYHHMMLATDAVNVGLCFEPHWIYRGAGNSQVAVFDILRLYGERIVSVHLRQSTGGVWNEVFGPGDIDYVRMARELATLPRRPLLVMEQAVEKGSPATVEATEAHRRGLQYVRRTFGAA